MGKSRSSWHLLLKKKHTTKHIFPQAFFPLHLKVKLCLSKINLSHVPHFFPLTANCSEKASCHIKDFHKVIFIPNEKTTFSLNTQYLMSKTHTYGSSSHLVKYHNNLLSADQFYTLSKDNCHLINAISSVIFIKSLLCARH